VDHPLGLVTRISTCPLQIKLTIPVATRPLQIAITPDGGTALVTSFDNAVNFIDLATNKVTFTLNTDSTINPNGIAISPDGTRAYVTSFNNTNSVVLVVDLGTRTVIQRISVDTYPLGASLTPDGSQLWVTFPFGQAVYVIDTLSSTIATLIPIPQTTGVAFNATGTLAYITSASGPPGAVVAVDTASFKVVKSYTVGLGPTDIVMSYADQFLVVNNNAGGSVSVIDLSKGVVNTTAVGNSPRGIAFVR
jgi:YVTN family beta-propeller protein